MSIYIMNTTKPINLFVHITCVSCDNHVITLSNRLHTSRLLPVLLLMRMHSSDVSAYFIMYDVTIENVIVQNVYVYTKVRLDHVQRMHVAKGGKR